MDEENNITDNYEGRDRQSLIDEIEALCDENEAIMGAAKKARDMLGLVMDVQCSPEELALVTCGYRHAGDYEVLSKEISLVESLASSLAWNLIAPRSGRGIAKNPEISIIQVPMDDVTPKSVETAVSGFFEEVRDLAPVIYWHLASQHENEAGVRVYKSGSTWVLEVAIEWEPMQ